MSEIVSALLDEFHLWLFEKELLEMAKQDKVAESVDELYEVMDIETYADSYDSINRNKPLLAMTIAKLVSAGQRPEDIKARHIRKFPTSFIQAQKIYEAAKYVDFMGDNL